MNITIEYIAGFTDGEGSIGLCGKGPRITWGQNKPEVLKAIRAWLLVRGVPCNWSEIKPKLPRRPNTCYMLFISRKDHCEKVCRLLLPFLIVKKGDCEGLLKWLQDHPYAYNSEPIDLGKLIELAEQGYTQGAISKMMGYCRQIISRTAKQHSIKFVSGGTVVDGKRAPAMTENELKEHRRTKEKSNRCVDCGATIYKPHQRCQSCVQKERRRKRKGSSSSM